MMTINKLRDSHYAYVLNSRSQLILKTPTQNTILPKKNLAATSILNTNLHQTLFNPTLSSAFMVAVVCGGSEIFTKSSTFLPLEKRALINNIFFYSKISLKIIVEV
jgi:hypothetical protein